MTEDLHPSDRMPLLLPKYVNQIIELTTQHFLGAHCTATKMVFTAQKMKFSIKDFFSKCDQIRSFLWIWSHSLKKYFIENFIFCAVVRIVF